MTPLSLEYCRRVREHLNLHRSTGRGRPSYAWQHVGGNRTPRETAGHSSPAKGAGKGLRSGKSTATDGPHYAACKGVGPGALRGAGLARPRPPWSSGRSFARLKQVSASLSHRALASGRPHCSAIATHAARRRRYSSECMLPSRHANIHPQRITSMRYRQRNMPLDRVMSFFLVLPGCRK
jgi:hypothetical protein